MIQCFSGREQSFPVGTVLADYSEQSNEIGILLSGRADVVRIGSGGERTLLEHLQEAEYVPGAMQCDYDYFKVLCFAESRAMERSGNATHVALLSVAGGQSREALEETMLQLGEQLRMNLRRGDTFSRCSLSQYIMMLPKANYENSCMVCRRCIGAFQRAHPRSSVKINYMVQPLGPRINVP